MAIRRGRILTPITFHNETFNEAIMLISSFSFSGKNCSFVRTSLRRSERLFPSQVFLMNGSTTVLYYTSVPVSCPLLFFGTDWKPIKSLYEYKIVYYTL